MLFISGLEGSNDCIVLPTVLIFLAIFLKEEAPGAEAGVGGAPVVAPGAPVGATEGAGVGGAPVVAAEGAEPGGA